MKLIKLLLLTGLGGLLTSCEFVNLILNPPTNDCVLQKTTWSIPNDPGQTINEYTYDANGYLAEVSRTMYDQGEDPTVSRLTVTYANNLVDQINVYFKFKNDPEQLETNYVFFYNGNLPDSIHYTWGETYNFREGYFLATYSEAHLTQLLEYNYNLFDKTYILSRTTTIEWTGDNVSKVTATDVYGNTSSHEYEYDDKKTPLNHLGMALSTFGSFTMLSKNNVTKSIYTVPDSTQYITEFAMTYNDSGYPVTITPDNDYPTQLEYICK